jgi:hypothetical protein
MVAVIGARQLLSHLATSHREPKAVDMGTKGMVSSANSVTVAAAMNDRMRMPFDGFGLSTVGVFMVVGTAALVPFATPGRAIASRRCLAWAPVETPRLPATEPVETP